VKTVLVSASTNAIRSRFSLGVIATLCTAKRSCVRRRVIVDHGA
jgi:hypothetical protein